MHVELAFFFFFLIRVINIYNEFIITKMIRSQKKKEKSTMEPCVVGR